MAWNIIIAHAENEEAIAEKLAKPLREAGYKVFHRGSVLVGENFTEEISKALVGGGPVVLCATVQALGTSWAHFVVNNSNRYNNVQVFCVEMEKGVHVQPLALNHKVAKYWENPDGAITELINSINKHYPINKIEKEIIEERLFFDRITNISGFDRECLDDFRSQLRDGIRNDYPSDLTANHFL